MPFERWSQLDPTTQDLWDQLSETTKAIILGVPLLGSSNPTGRTPTANRQVRSHEQELLNLLSAIPDFDNNRIVSQTIQETLAPVAGPATSGNTPDAVQGLTCLVNAIASNRISPGDLQCMMSDRTGSGNDTSTATHSANLTYHVRTSDRSKTLTTALVDRGANGGIAGADVCVIDQTHHSVDVEGIDNHRMTNILLVTAGAVLSTQHGEVLVIMHQYAYTGKGTSIHSPQQLEALDTALMTNPAKLVVPSALSLHTPMSSMLSPWICGLAQVKMHPYTMLNGIHCHMWF